MAWRSGLEGTWVPGVHASCGRCEVAALMMRSLAPLPVPADSPLQGEPLGVFARLEVLAGRYGGTRWSYLETAESYTGSLRRRYLEAERSLRVDGPLRSSDSYLRAFLKAEKLPASKDCKPRLIFPRSPRYNLALASWLKPFEHWLWGYLTARRLFGGSNTRVSAKGLNPRRRANLIQRKLNGLKDGVCFEVDGKAFEAHVTSGQVVAEHRVYRAAYPRDSGLTRVLARQVFRGVTTHGARFSRPGGRASGDFNTGMGNTLIMLAVVVGVLKSYRCKFDVLADGDNALIFLEGATLGRVLQDFAARVLATSGHEFTLERPVSYMEGVRFGRSAPVFLGDGLGWTMVREPESVLSGAYASHRWLREPVYGRRWVGGVARCELSLARGVPVLQSAALSVLEQTVGLKDVREEALADYFVVGAWLARAEDAIAPTLACRISFERAFGWSIERQLLAEGGFSKVQVGHTTLVQELPQSSNRFEAEPGLYEAWGDAQI